MTTRLTAGLPTYYGEIFGLATYLPTWAGFLYLAAVTDVFSRLRCGLPGFDSSATSAAPTPNEINDLTRIFHRNK